MQISAPSQRVDNIAEQQRPPVTEAAREPAKLMSGVGLGNGSRSSPSETAARPDAVCKRASDIARRVAAVNVLKLPITRGWPPPRDVRNRAVR